MKEFLIELYYGEKNIQFYEEGTDGQLILDDIISEAKKADGWIYVQVDAKNIAINLNSINSIEVIDILEQEKLDEEDGFLFTSSDSLNL